MEQAADLPSPDTASREVFGVAVAAMIAVAFFWAFPQADLIISGWFYTPDTGFELRGHFVLRAVYLVTLWMPRVLLLLLFIGVLVSVFTRQGRLQAYRRQLIFLFVASGLGAGVTVNWILKDHWGRARPQAIAEFGGNAHYTPPFEMAHECSRNCAFTSGHAASAFSLLAFGRMRKTNAKRVRQRWLVIGLVTGLLVGFARIAQGAHFPSDVLFSFFVVYAAIELTDQCCRWVTSLRGHEPRLPEPTAADG